MSKYTVALLVSLASVSGCASVLVAMGGTPKGDLDSLVGKPVSEAVIRCGAPSRSVPLPDSTTVHSWGVALDARENHGAYCVKSLLVSPKGTIMHWTGE
jgi:hypothetical protein